MTSLTHLPSFKRLFSCDSVIYKRIAKLSPWFYTVTECSKMHSLKAKLVMAYQGTVLSRLTATKINEQRTSG